MALGGRRGRGGAPAQALGPRLGGCGAAAPPPRRFVMTWQTELSRERKRERVA